jgi:hypothetical protein
VKSTMLRVCAMTVITWALPNVASASEHTPLPENALAPSMTDQPSLPNLADKPLYKWGVEAEAIQPFLPTINIFRIRGTRTLWGSSTGPRGDLIAGLYLRPGIKHDVLNYIYEYQLSAGYRQYFWRGFHAEAGLDAGAAWGTNRFDGKRYSTATLFLNANVGYRFGFFEPGGFCEDKRSRVGFYAIAQFGVLAGLGVADIGPRNGKPDVFPQGNLVLGISF